MKRPKSAWQLTTNKMRNQQNYGFDNNSQNDYNYNRPEETIRINKNVNTTDSIFALFSSKLFGELYFAWCIDCEERPSTEGAKYFRDELLARNNKDFRNFNFHSMRAGRNFLTAFGGNLPSIQINKIDLSDNLVNDECMHNIKNLISAKKIVYLNLASNQISTEGLKIIQQEIIVSKSLKYLNFGVYNGSFRINNFSGEGSNHSQDSLK